MTLAKIRALLKEHGYKATAAIDRFDVKRAASEVIGVDTCRSRPGSPPHRWRASPPPEYPGPAQAGAPIRLPGPLDPLTAHRTTTNTRIRIEPIAYDSEGAPLHAWQLHDEH